MIDTKNARFERIKLYKEREKNQTLISQEWHWVVRVWQRLTHALSYILDKWDLCRFIVYFSMTANIFLSFIQVGFFKMEDKMWTNEYNESKDWRFFFSVSRFSISISRSHHESSNNAIFVFKISMIMLLLMNFDVFVQNTYTSRTKL